MYFCYLHRNVNSVRIFVRTFSNNNKWFPMTKKKIGVFCVVLCQIIIPIAQWSCRVVYWFHSVHPSVRPSVHPASCVRSVAPPVLIRSISYLHILSSNFIRYVACKVSSKISIFYVCNFDFVLNWLGIWCESLVWVIMGQRGVSQNASVLVVLILFYDSISIHQHHDWLFYMIRLTTKNTSKIITTGPLWREPPVTDWFL